MRQIEVINQETIIDVTAETSNVEILIQDYDSELAERFALEAQEAAIDAEESADIATAQASIATAQAGIATTQAGIATTKAQEAAASAQEAQDIVDSITPADLTEATSSVLTITGGTDAVLGSGTTIQVKQAGSSQSGFLSSTDWSTFNSKQDAITNPITGTIATGQVAFGTAANTIGGDSGLVWSNLQKRLSIFGTAAETNLSLIYPTGLQSTFEIRRNDSVSFFRILNNASLSNISASAILRLTAGSGTITNFIGASEITRVNTTGISILTGANPTRTLDVNGTGRISNGVSLADTSGNVQIGTTTDAGFRLDVNGTARVQGVLTATADAVVNGVNVGRGGGAISTNTRVGDGALRDNTTGSNNTAIGYRALVTSQNGINNVGIGFVALGLVNNSSGNTALGYRAGRYHGAGSTNNLTLASNSIFIGFDSSAGADNQSNQIVIGHTAIGLGSNTTVIGNSSTTFGRWFGNLLVGTSTNAGFALDVNGTGRIRNAVTLADLSGNVLIGLGTSRTNFNQSTPSKIQSEGISFDDCGYSTVRNSNSAGASSLKFGKTRGTANLANTIVQSGDNLGVIEFQGADGTNLIKGSEIRGFVSGTPTLNNMPGGLSFWVNGSVNTTTQAMTLFHTGNFAIGTTTDVASSILTVESTTKGFLPPRMTTTQKNAIASPATGLQVFDTTLNQISYYNGTSWINL